MRHVLELHSNQIFVVSYLDIFGGGRGKKRIIRALYTQDIATMSNHSHFVHTVLLPEITNLLSHQTEATNHTKTALNSTLNKKAFDVRLSPVFI